MIQPRVRLWSDLHVEMRRNASVLSRLPRRADADLVLLAGDIGTGADGVLRAAEWFSDSPRIAYVLGNHEFYSGDLDEVLEACRKAAEGTAVRVLERESWDVFPGLRILGTTLWTDYALWGEETVEDAMLEAFRMADHRLITYQGRRFRPEDALRLHHESRAWLQSELDRVAREHVTAIVLTHHAPHVSSLGAQYIRQRDPLSASFASDLTGLLSGPTAPASWCSGHTHSNCDTRVGTTRLVSNQSGYLWLGECSDFLAEGRLVMGMG
jgi:hypothetical protein